MSAGYSQQDFNEFIDRLQLLINQNPKLIEMTLSNVFSMRNIGNKTHGDISEVAISEFVNQYMSYYSSTHVGKKAFRAKSREEDISIKNNLTGKTLLVSLKAYGFGPLQLSTDKAGGMYDRLERERATSIEDDKKILKILNDPAFQKFDQTNVISLIYHEAQHKFNVMVFDYNLAKDSTTKIVKVTEGRGRKHPVYRFHDGSGGYICEVRYGGTTANALQRGLWTHTGKAEAYFRSVTSGWREYRVNDVLLELIPAMFVASKEGHQSSLAAVRRDTERIIESGVDA